MAAKTSGSWLQQLSTKRDAGYSPGQGASIAQEMAASEKWKSDFGTIQPGKFLENWPEHLSYWCFTMCKLSEKSTGENVVSTWVLEYRVWFEWSRGQKNSNFTTPSGANRPRPCFLCRPRSRSKNRWRNACAEACAVRSLTSLLQGQGLVVFDCMHMRMQGRETIPSYLINYYMCVSLCMWRCVHTTHVVTYVHVDTRRHTYTYTHT